MSIDPVKLYDIIRGWNIYVDDLDGIVAAFFGLPFCKNYECNNNKNTINLFTGLRALA